MQVICDYSSHSVLFEMIKLLPSTISDAQCLTTSAHFKRPLCCPKLLISLLNLPLVNNRSKCLGCFSERITFLFLDTSERYD